MMQVVPLHPETQPGLLQYSCKGLRKLLLPNLAASLHLFVLQLGIWDKV